MRAYLAASMCVVGLTLAGAANAQPAAQPTPPVAPVNSPPEVIAPKSGSTDKLGVSKPTAGVVRPPNVDPQMSVKPPANEPSSGAVIPPPGTPGGNPNVQPK